jgi:ABC-type multidrug transport system ATPase subunit
MINNTRLKDIDMIEFNTKVAFVSQYDHFYVGLTPREVLMYTATLMMGHKFKQLDLASKVSYIIDLMDMTSFADVVVTDIDSIGGLSGGQSRKLSISIGLLKRPNIIVLDEPTSGLDSQSTMEVVLVLSTLAKMGYTVILTIHQPRKEVFSLFSHTLFLANGRVAFSGEAEQSKDAMIEIAKYNNISTPLNQAHNNINIADCILDILSKLPNDFKTNTVQHFTLKDVALPHTAVKPEIKKRIESLLGRNVGTLQPQTSFMLQFTVVNSRYWQIRPFYKKISMLVITITASIILGLLQRRPGDDTITLTLQIKAMMIACLGLSSLKNINISFDFYSDFDLYQNDLKNGLLPPSTFYIHRFVTESTMAMVESFLCGLITYYLLDCKTQIRTIIVLITSYYNCIVSLYVLIYSTKLDRNEARSVSFFIQALLIVTSGLWIKSNDTKLYNTIHYIQYINPNYWILNPLLKTILHNNGKCIIYFDNKCRIKWGDFVTELVDGGFDYSIDFCVIMMILLWIMMRILQYILLRNMR